MSYLVDTDVLVDVSRNNQVAIAYVDRLANDWAASAMTDDSIGRRAYNLLKEHAKADGLRTLDSLIASTAIEQRRTLVTRNHKHFRMVPGLTIDVPRY